MGYKRHIRALEGNKALARNLGSFIKRRDKLTRIEWEKSIKPLMKQAENDIITKLKSNSLTDWSMFNLNNILLDIQSSIVIFTNMFQDNLVIGELGMAEFSAEALGDSLKLVGLNKPPIVLSAEEMLVNQLPLSKSFVEFFGDDMAKIVRTEISLGLVNGESVNQVANKIKDKFKLSNMSYARAERITRTEMLTASSTARFKEGLEIEDFNPDARKMWIHNPSGDPRETHIAAQERYRANPIRISELFHVGGETGRFPRDLSFSAKNRVNCKCNMVVINKRNLDDLGTL